MKREGGREAGYCSKMLSDRGDQCLFTFLYCRRLFLNIFPFPVCKAQLIGDWYENKRGAPSTIILLIIRQYIGAPMYPCANRSGGPNTKKILLAHCAWSPLPIGGGGHRCANILAHRSTLHAHTTSVRKGYTFRFFNIMYSFKSPIGGPNISVRLAYFHPNRLLIELYKQETEIRCKKDDGPIKK